MSTRNRHGNATGITTGKNEAVHLETHFNSMTKHLVFVLAHSDFSPVSEGCRAPVVAIPIFQVEVTVKKLAGYLGDTVWPEIPKTSPF